MGGVICSNQECDGFIAKINKQDGTISSMEKYGASNVIDGFISLAKTTDGFYVAVGATNVILEDDELRSANIWVTKIRASDNTIVWQYDYGLGLAEVVKIVSDGIVVGGFTVTESNLDFLIMKLNFDGSILWAKSYGGVNTDELMDLVIDNNGNIVVVGSSKSITNERDGVIIKVSGNDGSIIWQRYFDSGNPGDEATSIVLTEDGYLISGIYAINYSDVIIAKLDLDGNIHDTCNNIYKEANFEKIDLNLTPSETSASSAEETLEVTNLNLTSYEPVFNFTQQCPVINYTLNITITNPDYGKILSEPIGIECGLGSNDCSEVYRANSFVSLFSIGTIESWGGDCSQCGTYDTCNITMDSNKNCIVTFAINKHKVTVNASGNGSGNVISNPAGLSLSYPSQNVGVANFDHGSTVVLTAQANVGSKVSWGGTCTQAGGTESGNDTSTAVCTLSNLSEAKTLIVTFSLITSVKVLTPNGGEIIPSGQIYQIQWEAPETAVKFTLKYSLNNGMTWTTISNNITGNSYNWLVPKPANNMFKCLIMVIAYNANNLKVGEDKSDKPFTIEVIKLNSPNGGETLSSGMIYNIIWTTNGTIRPVSKVILSYTLNGGISWSNIYTFTGSNPGIYTWTVPTVTATKTKCKIKIVLKDDAGRTIGTDISDGFFTINPPSQQNN
jgi:hypothetical protein